MNDQDFKEKVINDMAEMKMDIKYIKEMFSDKISTNRKLIYMLIGTYLVALVTIIISISKGGI